MEFKENRDTLMNQIKILPKLIERNKEKLNSCIVSREMISLSNTYSPEDLKTLSRTVYTKFCPHYELIINYLCHHQNAYKICLKRFLQSKIKNDVCFMNTKNIEEFAFVNYELSKFTVNVLTDLNIIMDNYLNRIKDIRLKDIKNDGTARYKLIDKSDYKFVVLKSMGRT